jgi:hypothetical protein
LRGLRERGLRERGRERGREREGAERDIEKVREGCSTTERR